MADWQLAKPMHGCTLVTQIEGGLRIEGGGGVNLGLIESYLSKMVGHSFNTLLIVHNTTAQGNNKCSNVFTFFFFLDLEDLQKKYVFV